MYTSRCFQNVVNYINEHPEVFHELKSNNLNKSLLFYLFFADLEYFLKDVSEDTLTSILISTEFSNLRFIIEKAYEHEIYIHSFDYLIITDEIKFKIELLCADNDDLNNFLKSFIKDNSRK